MPETNDPFENFDQGMHVDALPPAEIRRRGDKLRRRNTALATVGGVAAALVFIGTPVALLSGTGGDERPAPPIATQTTSPDDATWRTEIPAEFPLRDGFPTANGDGTATDVVIVSAGDGTPLTSYSPLCGVDWPALEPRQRATIGYTGESEDYSERALLLYADADRAEGLLDTLRENVQSCPDQPTDDGEGVIETRLVDFDLGTERSVVVAQEVVGDDGLRSQLLVTQVAQTGNAVYLEQSYGAAGGPDVIDYETSRLRDLSARPLASMCVFAADPCRLEDTSVSDSPSSDAGTESSSSIPADFPLAVGFGPASEEVQLKGPAADIKGVSALALCGTNVLPLTSQDRLVATESGPEYVQVRELTTFAGPAEAVSAVEAIRNAVGDCPEMPGDVPANDRIFIELEAETGYDSVTFGFHYREGTGGSVIQVTRVGSAVLVTDHSGEFTAGTLQAGADDATGENGPVVNAMCLWTEAGC
ncbi:hypothetical protein [Nocardioides sp.]|uniref:hypothetical protein n=1 Tax=Nocardioides sp. TaxID=35761 RepID=UPI003561375A